MDDEPTREANAQLARAREPSVRALDHPTMPARALAAFDASPSGPARDPALPEIRSAPLAVVDLVGMQLRRSSEVRRGWWGCTKSGLSGSTSHALQHGPAAMDPTFTLTFDDGHAEVCRGPTVARCRRVR